MTLRAVNLKHLNKKTYSTIPICSSVKFASPIGDESSVVMATSGDWATCWRCPRCRLSPRRLEPSGRRAEFGRRRSPQDLGWPRRKMRGRRFWPALCPRLPVGSCDSVIKKKQLQIELVWDRWLIPSKTFVCVPRVQSFIQNFQQPSSSVSKN